MTDGEFIEEIKAQWSLMVAVATGGPSIPDVEWDYTHRRERIEAELRQRGLNDPNPYDDLWAWYGRWTSGLMPTWASRREHLARIYMPLLKQIQAGSSTRSVVLHEEPVGWDRVDRCIGELRRQLPQAVTEEQLQSLGLVCRETLISLAQAVYDPQRHRTTDDVVASTTDSKRMLDAYVAEELSGEQRENMRRVVKAAIALADGLVHHRAASYREAALCAEATASVVDLVAIVSGRRDRLNEVQRTDASCESALGDTIAVGARHVVQFQDIADTLYQDMLCPYSLAHPRHLSGRDAISEERPTEWIWPKL